MCKRSDILDKHELDVMLLILTLLYNIKSIFLIHGRSVYYVFMLSQWHNTHTPSILQNVPHVQSNLTKIRGRLEMMTLLICRYRWHLSNYIINTGNTRKSQVENLSSIELLNIRRHDTVKVLSYHATLYLVKSNNSAKSHLLSNCSPPLIVDINVIDHFMRNKLRFFFKHITWSFVNVILKSLML